MKQLKASSKSNPNSIAGALVATINESETGSVEIQTVGAGALNQAIKAIAIARGFIAPSGRDLACCPSFTNITINGEDRTSIVLTVKIEKK